MPLQKRTSKEACISYNYNEMIKAGHPKKQARAAALSFCDEKWEGIPKKKDKSREILTFLKVEVENETEDLRIIQGELTEIKKKYTYSSKKKEG